MGLSISYSALRSLPLSPAERQQIKKIQERFSIRKNEDSIPPPRESFNGEDLEIFENSGGRDSIIEGATALPTSSEEHLWFAVQRWCEALSEIRRSIPGAVWSVVIDNHEIVWDKGSQCYDPHK